MGKIVTSIKNKKEVLTMTETDLAAALRHCIDDCGCSWPTACQILSRMAGRAYTLAELRDLYRLTKSAIACGFAYKAKILSHVEIRRLFHVHPSS